MASRAKKEADTAMSKLKDYLRRDIEGRQLLADAERYLGGLRQEKAGLKHEIELLTSKVSALTENVARACHEVAASKQQLEAASVEQRKLAQALAASQKEVKELKAAYEPEEDITDTRKLPRARNFTVDRLLALGKQLRRMRKIPPDMEIYDGIGLFNLEEFADNSGDYNYSEIGMYVVFAAHIGFRIVCECNDMTDQLTEEQRLPTARWAREWFVNMANNERILSKSATRALASRPHFCERLFFENNS